MGNEAIPSYSSSVGMRSFELSFIGLRVFPLLRAWIVREGILMEPPFDWDESKLHYDF